MPVFRVASSSPYAPVIGFSSAVRAGNLVFVAGTTAVDSSGAVIGGDDPYAQTQEALRKISAMLAEAGTDWSHVVQTRMYLVRSEHWEHGGRAHREVFAENPPAATMVVVAGLLDPRTASYTHLRAHETGRNLVCRLLLEKKKI